MSYEEYMQQREEALKYYDGRLERLQQQEVLHPDRLRVKDEDAIRMLLLAGMGGSY